MRGTVVNRTCNSINRWLIQIRSSVYLKLLNYFEFPVIVINCKSRKWSGKVDKTIFKNVWILLEIETAASIY